MDVYISPETTSGMVVIFIAIGDKDSFRITHYQPNTSEPCTIYYNHYTYGWHSEKLAYHNLARLERYAEV